MFTITKKKDNNPYNQSYVCPNPSCGKVFTAPIKAENLNLKHAKRYDACSYCLTEITVEKSSPEIETSQKPEVEVKVKAPEVKISREKETLQTPLKHKDALIILDI
ncbi:MAG: hypothetical protein QME50_04430 [Candidatus Bathyarchaeota archaeon]|nr:hypothetical protein [Candidatus Bathyarchaeota archaeon]